ncbi:hypothetical protein K0M31_016084 [Melipona bicolor]|uniref:Uncharacterized protein n=1 Tax=Melipona bicolor TaxID=60889 RepID=A0AA40G6G6_9HYME|nr:hypothetical protein K0M31_016084 [Melipona bicolor]
MVEVESKEIESDAPGTPNSEKRKRRRPLKEGNRSRESSSNRTMMKQWNGFTGKEDKAEEIEIEESKRVDRNPNLT